MALLPWWRMLPPHTVVPCHRQTVVGWNWRWRKHVNRSDGRAFAAFANMPFIEPIYQIPSGIYHLTPPISGGDLGGDTTLGVLATSAIWCWIAEPHMLLAVVTLLVARYMVGKPLHTHYLLCLAGWHLWR